MMWRVEFRPEVEQDVLSAAEWYESRQPGLGRAFVDEMIQVWDALTTDPQLPAPRHAAKNIRWRYPERFPYRIVYTISESTRTVLVIAVLHASRHDRHWQKRT